MTRGARPSRMPRPLVAFALVLMVALAAAAPAWAKAQVGQPAPAFSLSDRDGRTVKLADLRGKVVVVDFWASWCAPCKKALPAYDALAAAYAAKGAKVVFVAINIDGNQKNAAKLLAAIKTLVVLFDPSSQTVAAYDVPTMPTTYVVDPQGVVRFVNPGFEDGHEKKLGAQIDKLLPAK